MDIYAQSLYFLEVDLSYPEGEMGSETKKRLKKFKICTENKKTDNGNITDFMHSIKPKNYRTHNEPTSDWSNKEDNLVYCRRLKFLVRQEKKIKKTKRVISFKQKPWLVAYTDLITK